MRPWIPLLVLTIFAACASSSRGDRMMEYLNTTTPEDRSEKLTGLMHSALDLTPEQMEKVQSINLRYARKIEALIQTDADEQEMLWKAREVFARKDQELRKVFDDRQYAIYIEKKEEIRNRLMEQAAS